MRILAYLCIHIVILTQSFPSVECLPITDCLEGDECGEQRQMTTNVPTQVTPTTTSWSFRRIICPPFFPDLKETLFELERMIYEKTRQGYDAAKELFKQSPETHSVEKSTSTQPTEELKTTVLTLTTADVHQQSTSNHSNEFPHLLS